MKLNELLMFNFLKPNPPHNDTLGRFLRANCKQIWIHEDGYEELFNGLTDAGKTVGIPCKPAGKVSFALYGTIDLNKRENIALCKLCLKSGMDILCDSITYKGDAKIWLKGKELVK